jgi:hypothetical protein
MKQYQSQRGPSFLENVTDWSAWLLYEGFQGFLGSVWIGLFLMFAMFFYNYHYYYHMGVTKKDKSSYLTL